MTLMAVGNSEGVRRCTALCYDARGPRCECVCHGANHGKGLDAAMKWSREHASEVLKAAGVNEIGELFAEGAVP